MASVKKRPSEARHDHSYFSHFLSLFVLHMGAASKPAKICDTLCASTSQQSRTHMVTLRRMLI